MDTGKRIVLEEEVVLPTAAPPPGARTELAALTPEEERIAEATQAPVQDTPPRRGRALLVGAGLAGTLVVLHTLTGLYTLLQESPVLGVAWTATIALLAGAGGRAAWRMWQRLQVLKRQEDLRARAEHLLTHQGVSEGVAFCEQLAREAKLHDSAEYRRWRELVSATHNDREVLQTWNRIVLPAADARALECVSRHAGDVSVMVAVSYFPAVDMLLVLWRQLQMVEDVAAVYGLDPGYWGRIQLLRKALRNMALAGAAEIATEVGMEALGAGAAAKLSGALAQGVAAGVLTARLGLRTLDACRALPWEPEQRPRLRNVTAGVIERARQHLGDKG